MPKRGRRDADAVYYDHLGTACRDSRYHRTCRGRWRAKVSLGKDATGKRKRRPVSAQTKTELYEKLDDIRQELAVGVRSSATYTVDDAVSDWLARVPF